jgi:type II secretory pathway pseudopilin PulG
MKRETMKQRAKHRRGFTMIELMVGAATGVLISLAAFTLARTQMKQLDDATETVQMAQVGRAALSLIADDARYAGAGLGLRADRRFAGLLTGDYSIGGATFKSTGTLVQVGRDYAIPSDDLGFVLASGPYATIAAHSVPGVVDICAGSKFATNSLVVMRAEDSLSARSVLINSISPTTCTYGSCVRGCERVAYSEYPFYVSDTGAQASFFPGGDLGGGMKSVVWFVEADDPARPFTGTLHRAVFDATNTCPSRGASCGSKMAERVETLQFKVWTWRSDTSSWVDVSAGPLEASDRLRLDVELVVRAKSASERKQSSIPLTLESNTCVPNCNGGDKTERRAFRTSIELKNSGR